MKAAEDVFEVLERPAPTRRHPPDVPDPSRFPLCESTSSRSCYPDRAAPGPVGA